MKKIILSITTFISLSLAGQHDMYPSSVNVVLGKDINSIGTGLSNGSLHGFRYNKNIYNSSQFDIDTYQIALDISTPTLLSNGDSTTQLRVGGNMIWSIDSMNTLTPYFLLGAGFSYLGTHTPTLGSFSLYSNLGGGVDFMIRDDFSLTGEAKYVYYGKEQTSTSVNVGLKFNFGD